MRLACLQRPASIRFTIGVFIFASTLGLCGAFTAGLIVSDLQHGAEISALSDEVAHLNARLAAKPTTADLILDNENCLEATRLCYARKRNARIKMKGTL
jgi:hypothetical protein